MRLEHCSNPTSPVTVRKRRTQTKPQKKKNQKRKTNKIETLIFFQLPTTTNFQSGKGFLTHSKLATFTTKPFQVIPCSSPSPTTSILSLSMWRHTKSEHTQLSQKNKRCDSYCEKSPGWEWKRAWGWWWKGGREPSRPTASPPSFWRRTVKARCISFSPAASPARLAKPALLPLRASLSCFRFLILFNQLLKNVFALFDFCCICFNFVVTFFGMLFDPYGVLELELNWGNRFWFLV